MAKDMGSCEIYPQTIAHNPNGRFVVVCGDGEYIIYTSMALRNKAFGTAQEFVWAFDSSEYATLENSSTIKVFKNFKERKSFKPEYGAEGNCCNACYLFDLLLCCSIDCVNILRFFLFRHFWRIHARCEVHQWNGFLLLRLGTLRAD